MLILWLTYLLSVGPLRGIPLLSVPGYVMNTVSSQIIDCQSSCMSPQSLRDVYAVLFIIVGGAWITCHPDIPPSRQSGFASLKSGTLHIFYALLTPEFVVIRALQEYVRAGRIADNYNADSAHGQSLALSLRWTAFQMADTIVVKAVTPTQWSGNREMKEWLHGIMPRSSTMQSPSSWTRAHGFFVQMGGFVLYDTAAASRRLSYEELRNLIEDRVIARPRVTEEEINDRSKGEFISRALIAFLTLSFAVKCATKLFNGVVLSNVEIITLLYAGLDAAAYMLWWSKPQNVAQAIAVDVLHPNRYINEKPELNKE